jgi:hypothetical protein
LRRLCASRWERWAGDLALVCYKPISDTTADFFDLVVSWSSDDLDSSLPELIEREIRDIEWDRCAVDDNF